MKKIVSAAIALAMILPAATPAMAAPPSQENARHDNGRHDNARRDDRRAGSSHSRYQPNPFRKGQRFEQRRAPNYRVVDYRQYRGLHAPQRGYRWVQSGGDALLVGIATGVIASVVVGAFN